ncbi:MAG: hypothetical protein HY269_04055, partial [Deltaproteobacteria bacterium]|nr:hypothetical protein [Deltaproteobacteria bacterium]
MSPVKAAARLKAGSRGKAEPARKSRTKAVPVKSQESAEKVAGLLEAHRDHTFRRLLSRRVTGEQSALAFIDETGFCAAFTAGLGVPCLREAIEGRREPKLPEHIQHDRAIMMTWN